MPALALLLAACATEPAAPGSAGSEPAAPASSPAVALPATPAPAAAPAAAPAVAPVVQALAGPPGPALLLAQSVLVRDDAGQPHTAPARLDILRPAADGAWATTRVEDPDSNVFHKALVRDGAVLTIGAEAALLKRWTPTAEGWQAEVLWRGDWPGRYDRLRDAEVGDVDADGRDELVIATHDHGVIAVVELDDPAAPVLELGATPDVFVHEIELADLDGDGRREIYATPSGRNLSHATQAGGILRLSSTEQGWQQRWIAGSQETHAKEILAADLDGDGRDELYGVFAAAQGPEGQRITPIQVARYRADAAGEVRGEVIATLDDKDARALVAGDFDRDGRPELALGAFKAGLFHLRPPAAGAGEGSAWTLAPIDAASSGFEHALLAADLDEDGHAELYASSDDQGELRRYDLDPATGRWTHRVLAPLDDHLLRMTWNLTAGTL